MKYLYIIFPIVLLLIGSPEVHGQDTEGIRFDSTNNYYVISYCCTEEGNLQKGAYLPGDLVEPEIEVSVEYLPSSNTYNYQYTVRNKESTRGLLYEFSVKKGAEIIRKQRPDHTWVIYNMPDTTISWSRDRARIHGIKAGEQLAGFGIESPGLPSIVPVFAASNTSKSFPDEGPPSSKLKRELAALEKATQHVELKSIGPRELPENITKDEILENINSYLAFSCDTTWVTNRGICRSLQAKLDNVEKHLSKDKIKQAINVLNAFLNEVAAQRGKHITSEGYALLWFNGLELLERLGGEKKSEK